MRLNQRARCGPCSSQPHTRSTLQEFRTFQRGWARGCRKCQPAHNDTRHSFATTKRRSNSVAKHTKHPSCWVANRLLDRQSIPCRVTPANCHVHHAEVPQGCGKHRHPATRNESPDVLLRWVGVCCQERVSYSRHRQLNFHTSLEAQNCRWKDRRPPILEMCQSNLCPHVRLSSLDVALHRAYVFPVSRPRNLQKMVKILVFALTTIFE